MSVVKTLMPYVARILASSTLQRGRQWRFELQRILRAEAKQIEVFLNIQDPYAYGLAQVLPAFQARFNLPINVRFICEYQEDVVPEPELLRQYAKDDAAYLARLYQLQEEHFADVPQAQVMPFVAAYEWRGDRSPQAALAVFEQVRTQQPAPVLTLAQQDAGKVQITLNQQRLQHLGHYNSAVLFYAGEWFWGLDRLHYLERRLNREGLNIGTAQVLFKQTQYPSELNPEQPLNAQHEGAQLPPLTLYWSARSPYSYLALLRCQQLATCYRLPFEVKPVMPMMMRNMPVPQRKKMAIFYDTVREARHYGIPYGQVADPLGAGVERCYALLAYARQAQGYLAFLQSFARGVNSQGLQAESDKGMAKIVSNAGLDWREAQRHINSNDWRDEVANNFAQMQLQGLWGVPCIHFAGLWVWGQDRIARVAAHVESVATSAHCEKNNRQ